MRRILPGFRGVTKAILLALLAYAVWAWGDGFTKSLGGELPVFEIVFFISSFSALTIILTRPREERWRDFWRMERPWVIQVRAAAGVISGFCGVYAFTTIPLAEAYALIFLAPLFITVLSVVVLRESVGPWRWAAVVAGFAGVLLVVRPGFRELHLGHLGGLTVASMFAISQILLRSLASRERYTAMFGTGFLYNITAYGIVAFAVGFVVPDLSQLARLATIGICSASGQIILLRVARFAPANVVAPMHYSQIGWAVLIGAVFFDEVPDGLAFVGLAVLAGAGLLTLLREKVRLGTVQWNPFIRNRV